MSPINRFRAVRAAALLLSLSATTAATVTSAHAQAAPRPLTGRLSGGAYGQGSDPRGDFGANTKNAWGFGGNVIYRFDDTGIAHWRADFSFLTHDNSRRRIPLANTGGLVQLDLKTSNNIVSVVTGPQLMGPKGAIMPYAAALGGFTVFWTESTVEGSQSNEPFASTTNHNDAVLTYGGQAGLYIRVFNGARPVRLDLGARLLRHDNAQYLNDQRVRDAFENDRPPVPLRGRADFVTYYLGVNAFIF